MARLDLKLLGGFEARLASDSTVNLPVKAQALLAYLALGSGQAHPRGKLAALLWADSAAPQARASLRQTLSTLGSALPGMTPLVTADHAVVLDAAATDVDVAAFERAVAEGAPEALERAVALYRGDLLEGLGATPAPFEEWLLTERERLRELALEALAKLLAHYRELGRGDEAMRTALRLLSLDPVQEPVHRTLMRVYAHQGRRGAALRQYQVCVDVLQRDLRVAPEPETSRLYQEILQARASAPRLVEVETAAGLGTGAAAGLSRALPDRSLPLVGRDEELGQLRQACERAWRGDGQLAAIVGDPGIGKSRLAAELITDAAERNARVLFGRAQEAEQIIPFGLWADALRAGQVIEQLEQEPAPGPAWRTELGRLFPTLGTPEPHMPPAAEDHLRLFEALARLLEYLTTLHPLLVVLDDLHWADDMSVRFLSFVSRRVPDWRATVVVTARQEELVSRPLLQQTLIELARRERLLRLDLGPLSRPATLSLVQAFTPHGTETTALTELTEQVWTATDGNPFVVVETMRALSEGGAREPLTDLPLPQRVRDLIAGRLDRVDDLGRQLVAVAAVIGAEFDFPLLSRAAGVAPAEAAVQVEALVARRLLHAVGERLAFAHDRIREVAYERSLPMRRRLLHGQVAEALEALGNEKVVVAAPELLAHHFTEAGLAARAIPYWQQAGMSAAERAANQQAITAFNRAIDLLQALPESPEQLERELMLRMNVGAQLIGLQGWGASEVEATFTRALELCRRIRDTPYLAAVWIGLSQFRTVRAEYRKGLEMVREALRLAEAAQADALLLDVHRLLGGIGCVQGELDTAQEHFALAFAIYDPARHRSHVLIYGQDSGVVCAALRAWTLWMQGFPDQALGQALEGIALAERAAHPFSLSIALFFAVYVRFHCGEAATQELAEKVLRHTAEHGHYFWRICTERVLARMGGEAGAAAAGIATTERCNAASDAIGAGIFRSHFLGFEAELYGLAGKPDEGLARIAQALEFVQNTTEHFSEAELHRIRGELLLLQTPPDASAAEASFREAIAVARRQRARSWELRAATSLARMLSTRDQDVEGRRELAAVYDQFTEGSDTRDLREARALLERLSA